MSLASIEWRRGWRIVIASLAGMTFSNAQLSLLGLMIRPLSTAFGWSRAEISASALISSVCVLVGAPIAGRLADRFSPRVVALLGVVIFSVAQVCVGFSGPLIESWYASWVFAGLAYAIISPVVWSYGVNRWFDKARGLALAVALSGTGIAGSIAPLLAVQGIDLFGWRGVYFSIAGIGILLVLPLVWLLFRMPADYSARRGSTLRTSSEGWKNIRNRTFWMLGAAIALLGAGMGTLAVHVQPIMRDAGLSAQRAATFASFMGLSQVFGRLLVGQLLDRFPTRLVAAVAFAMPLVAAVLLIPYRGGTPESIAICVAIGLALGAEVDVMAYLTSRYFGLANYGLSYAILFGLWGVSFGVSSVASGAIYDITKSYGLVLRCVILFLFFSSVLVALTRPPPPRDQDQDQDQEQDQDQGQAREQAEALERDALQEAVRPADFG